MFPIVDVWSSDGDVRAMGRLSYRAKFALRIFALKFAFALVFFGLTYSGDAQAYAWMIRHSYTACGSCHADPSGGELLTHYGRVTSDLVLRTQYGGGNGDEKESKNSEGPPTGMFWGALDLPKALLMSGSYRNLYLIRPGEDKVFTFVPVMQADLYAQVRAGPITAGGSLGIAKVPDGSPHARPAQITSGPGDSVNLISRTHYLGADLGDKVVVRAGRLNLPFGVRMPEHTLWAREATRTDRESDQQHGVALAYVGENLRMEVMGIAGNFQTRLEPGGIYSDLSPGSIHERGYSMFVEGISGTTFAAGVSSKVTFAELDRITLERKSLRQAHGLTMRWAAHETLTFMSEMNSLFRTNANPGYVGFAQADWEPVQGLHFMLTGELLDQGLRVQSAGEETPIAQLGLGAPRTGGWVSLDWFFFRQMEFRTDLLLRQNEPLTIMGQFHMYL